MKKCVKSFQPNFLEFEIVCCFTHRFSSDISAFNSHLTDPICKLCHGYFERTKSGFVASVWASVQSEVTGYSYSTFFLWIIKRWWESEQKEVWMYFCLWVMWVHLIMVTMISPCNILRFVFACWNETVKTRHGDAISPLILTHTHTLKTTVLICSVAAFEFPRYTILWVKKNKTITRVSEWERDP